MRTEEELSKAIYQARNDMEALRALLAEVNAWAANAAYRPRRTRMSILHSMRDVAGEDYKLSREIILHELWPLCIENAPREEEEDENKVIEDAKGRKIYMPSRRDEDMWEANDARDFLASWVSSWLEAGHPNLRREVYDFARGVALSNGSVEAASSACWVFSHLGWRSPKAEETLWRVLQRNDKAGDVANNVIANLGVPPELHGRYIKQLRERAKLRPTRYNSQPMAQLAEADLVQDALAVFRAESPLRWLYGNRRPSGETGRDLEDKLFFLASVAEALWEHNGVQDEIWNAIYQTCRETREGRRNLFFLGNVMSSCHTPNVIRDFLATLPDVIADAEEKRQKSRKDSKGEGVSVKKEKGDPAHWPLYLSSQQLLKSLSPRQLSAWENLGDEAFQPFYCLARSNTFQVGYHSTTPMDAKEDAWRMLAFGGGRWVPEDVQQGIADESSGFVRGQVAEIVACFGCSPLPPIVSRLLTADGDSPQTGLDLSQKNEDDEEGSSQFFAYRGLENLARATATREAFEVLLNFGFVYRGDVLRSTSDSLQEVAVYLVQNGDKTITDELWQATASSSPNRKRVAAVSALHGLAVKGLLPASDWEKFLPLARETGLGDYFQALAVQAVGFLEDEIVRTGARKALVAIWQNSRSKASIELVGRARESLARHGTWEMEKPEQYLDDLGLEKREGKWRMQSSGNVESNDMASLYFLYRREPERFREAVCDVLQSQRHEAAYALTFWLVAREWGEQVTFEPAVADTLLAQLSEILRSVPHYMFSALSIGSPERLLDYDWADVIQQWPGAARVALADSMARTGLSGALSANPLRTLEVLLHDGSFPVRRAAIRAWYLLDSHSFAHRCRLLAGHPHPFERQVAAEAVFWWEEPLRNKRGGDIQQLLLCDREASVRQTAKESRKTHRERAWADVYWQRVTSVALTEQAPGSAYAYGFALQDLGDDWHLYQIDHADYGSMHPAIRFWHREIREALGKNWEKKSREWNLLSEGVVTETLDGTISFDESTIEVEVWLWLRPRAGVRGTSSWGGYLKAKDLRPTQDISRVNTVGLKLNDGRYGKIALTSTNWTLGSPQGFTAHFSGQGALNG